MRRAAFAVLVAANLMTSAAALADPATHIETIVDATVTPEMLGGAADVFRPMFDQMMQAPTADGRTLTPEARGVLVEELTDVLVGDLLEDQKVIQRKVLREHYSDEALSAYADFLETPGGVEIMAKMPDVMRSAAEEGMRLGASAGGDVMLRALRRLAENGETLFEDGDSFNVFRDILRDNVPGIDL